MNNDFDPYEILGLDGSADGNQIKAAFRALTLKHHPDRNKTNPNYDEQVYQVVCKAYAILKDPMKRRMFDNRFAAQHYDMRTGAQDYWSQFPASELPKQQRGVAVKQKFSEGDLDSFNAAFERSRAIDPNDRGYGDQMIEKESPEDYKNRRDVSVQNMFGGKTNVDHRTFNEMFVKKSRNSSRTELVERQDEPFAFAAQTTGAFQDIAVYDGMIVGRETSDFSKYDGGGLGYSDYMQGFETKISNVMGGQLGEDAAIDQREMKEKLDQRIAQRTMPAADPSMSKQEQQRRFQMAAEKMDEQFMQRLQEEEEQSRGVVFKYKDQYTRETLDPRRNHSAPSQRVNLSAQKPTFGQSQALGPSQSARLPPPPAQPARFMGHVSSAPNLLQPQNSSVVPQVPGRIHNDIRMGSETRGRNDRNFNDLMNERLNDRFR